MRTFRQYLSERIQAPRMILGRDGVRRYIWNYEGHKEAWERQLHRVHGKVVDHHLEDE